MSFNNGNFDIYQVITDKIIAKLESGVVPWQRGWSGTAGGAFNRVTKQPYSLLNQLILKNEGDYASFKQWAQLGGHVKKGAKSEMVVFWKIYKKEERKKNDKTGLYEKIEVKIPVLRYYPVFHISQVEGVEPLEKREVIEHNPIEAAEKVINNYINSDNLTFINDKPSNRAFYSPASDSVTVPMINQFKHLEEYYSTAFHELVHSTKHKNRLDRGNEGLSHFGSADYSKEELVAEIGACNLLSILNIDTEKTFNNNTAYIDGWLSVLKNDKKFIVSAASKAEKACKYILSFTDELKQADEQEEPEEPKETKEEPVILQPVKVDTYTTSTDNIKLKKRAAKPSRSGVKKKLQSFCKKAAKKRGQEALNYCIEYNGQYAATDAFMAAVTNEPFLEVAPEGVNYPDIKTILDRATGFELLDFDKKKLIEAKEAYKKDKNSVTKMVDDDNFIGPYIANKYLLFAKDFFINDFIVLYGGKSLYKFMDLKNGELLLIAGVRNYGGTK